MSVAQKAARSEPIVVRPDAKGRITLGKFAEGVSSFMVSQDDEGRLVLEPYKEIPAREAWLYANPVAIDKVRRGLADLGSGRVKERGDFSQYAEDDDE